MTDKQINIALAVAHEAVGGKRGAFIKTHGFRSYVFENDFSFMILKKLQRALAIMDINGIHTGSGGVVCDVKFINDYHESVDEYTGEPNKLDLALTIHFDSYPAHWREMTRVFYGKHKNIARVVAKNISGTAVEHGQCGYKSMAFIRDTDMPALLIEAFNGKDPAIERLFADGLYSERAQKWMDNFVARIAAGIKEYYDRD